MYVKEKTEYIYWYYPWFQHPLWGLGRYPPHTSWDYYILPLKFFSRSSHLWPFCGIWDYWLFTPWNPAWLMTLLCFSVSSNTDFLFCSLHFPQSAILALCPFPGLLSPLSSVISWLHLFPPCGNSCFHQDCCFVQLQEAPFTSYYRVKWCMACVSVCFDSSPDLSS